MRTKRPNPRSRTRVSKSRWAAYATAAAATVVVSIETTEADITYSGTVNRPFADTNPGGPGGVDFVSFYFASNASFALFHGRNSNTGGGSFNEAGFYMFGEVSGMFRGTAGSGKFRYPSRLGSGVNVSAGNFVSGYPAALAGHNLGGTSFGNFTNPGIGFIGFKFNGGAGTQYGWIRLQMNGPASGNTFTLVDYAFADVGEPISTGQVPEPNSLAFLAFGGAGLIAWRKWRARVAETE